MAFGALSIVRGVLRECGLDIVEGLACELFECVELLQTTLAVALIDMFFEFL